MGRKWRQRKLIKYIKNNNLSKFKSFVRKYDIDLNNEQFGNGNTVLHLACQEGCDAIVSFLLKNGFDVMVQNEYEQLALHIACYYALEGHQYAETDVVLPLIKECPSSLDIASSDGITPRMLLESIKLRLKDQLQDEERVASDLSSDASDTKSECSSDSNRLWHDKIASEAQDEFDEMWGKYQYHQDNVAESKPETFDDWAERISAEYADKCKHWYKKRVPSTASSSEKYRTPKISEEKMKQFEKKMAEAQKELQHGIEERKHLHLFKTKTNYEQTCYNLFKQKASPVENKTVLNKDNRKADSSKTALLRYDDIPWPHPPDCDLESVEEFLFGNLKKGSEEYKNYLKKQQVQWHPDRFLHRCGSLLDASHRHRILEKVKALSQLMNRLSQEVRQ